MIRQLLFDASAIYEVLLKLQKRLKQASYELLPNCNQNKRSIQRRQVVYFLARLSFEIKQLG